MEARMKNPAMVLPGAFDAIQDLVKAVHKGGVLPRTLELVHQRASQINGCAACLDMGGRGAKKSGETDERLWTVAAWRESPYFTDSERAALALAESMTRIADRRHDAVPDDVWDEVADHFDEAGLAALILWIATTNLFNRINTAVKEPAGASWG